MIFLCSHPAHPIEFAMAVLAMGGISGTLLWARCWITTTWKSLIGKVRRDA